MKHVPSISPALLTLFPGTHLIYYYLWRKNHVLCRSRLPQLRTIDLVSLDDGGKTRSYLDAVWLFEQEGGVSPGGPDHPLGQVRQTNVLKYGFDSPGLPDVTLVCHWSQSTVQKE